MSEYRSRPRQRIRSQQPVEENDGIVCECHSYQQVSDEDDRILSSGRATSDDDSCREVPLVYHRECPPNTIPPIIEGPPGAMRAVCPPGTLPSDKRYDLHDQYGRVLVVPEATRIKRKYVRLILFLLYIISIIIMIVDLILNITENIVFYIVTNAILLFRIFGVNIVTKFLHIGLFITLIIMFAVIDYKSANTFNAMCCFIPVLLVFMLGLHVLIIRKGRTLEQKANRASCHALMGLLVVIIVFWVVVFLINFNDVQCILEMIYFFIFLIIVLTPHFQSRTQAVAIARKATERIMEPCPAPPCCIPETIYRHRQPPFICPEPGGLQLKKSKSRSICGKRRRPRSADGKVCDKRMQKQSSNNGPCGLSSRSKTASQPRGSASQSSPCGPCAPCARSRNSSEPRRSPSQSSPCGPCAPCARSRNSSEPRRTANRRDSYRSDDDDIDNQTNILVPDDSISLPDDFASSSHIQIVSRPTRSADYNPRPRGRAQSNMAPTNRGRGASNRSCPCPPNTRVVVCRGGPCNRRGRNRGGRTQ